MKKFNKLPPLWASSSEMTGFREGIDDVPYSEIASSFVRVLLFLLSLILVLDSPKKTLEQPSFIFSITFFYFFLFVLPNLARIWLKSRCEHKQ